MLVPIAPILLLLSSALAAPSNEAPQLSFNLADSTQTGFFTSLAHQFTNSLLSSVGLASSTLVNEYGLQPKDETKTIWKAINENEHFSQLAHVLNYSSDATKKLLDDENAKITLFAPINWYHNKSDSVSFIGLSNKESSLGAGQEISAISELSQIERQIQEYEQFAVSSKDDADKERRRRIIAHIIDAVLSYHIVDSDSYLSYSEISRNSSVASKLNLGRYHKKVELGSLSGVHESDFPNLNDGQAWRVRVGKSLLPVPAVYLNFYSRVVSPDHQLKNGLLHAVSAPLLPPPSVIQSIYFGIPDYASIAAALLKTGGDKFLGLPHHNHSDSSATDAHHPGTTALTFFAPGNSAFYKLPIKLRLFLFSPFGEKLLAKILMLHSLPFDIVFADSVHHVEAHQASHQSSQVESYQSHDIKEAFGAANITKYTFKSALPKLNCSESHFKTDSSKLEFEEVDVEVARYYLLPGGRGPLQTRMSVQGVGVLLQDIPSSNGVFHTLTSFLKPKGHPNKDSIWGVVAQEAERTGFGKVDLENIDWN